MPSWRYGACISVLSALFGMCAKSAADTAMQLPTPVDPLTVSIHIDDAQRFARLFTTTGGRPTADQIQTEYLDHASYGVSVFTDHRIESANHLAATVSANREDYASAIQNCLPYLREYNSDLRSIFLAMHGLFPDRPLPQIYVVFGAGNSGGTAGPGVQVLGLEVLCKTSGGTEVGLRNTMRRFFAHETVHTLQADPADGNKSPLLAQVLTEGGADFIASIVTGETPEPERASWATQRESFLWSEFQKDLIATQPSSEKAQPAAAKQASLRWVGNYQNAPSGWPFEIGYWEGLRIWQCYYESAPDKHKAVNDVLNWTDPEVVLKESGYRGSACGQMDRTASSSSAR